MEIGRHGGMIASEHIRIGNNQKEKTFKYSVSLVRNQNVDLNQDIHVIIQSKHLCRLDFSQRI